MMSRITTLARCLAIASVLAVATSCGGSDDGSATDSSETADVTQTAASSEDTVSEDSPDAAAPAADGFDIPEGLVTADGLIPELASIPVPEAGVAFLAGSAYTAEQDPRQTAVQQVHFTAPPAEIAAFYLRELPAAGFELTGRAGSGDYADPAAITEIVSVGGALEIEFNDPSGLPGVLFVSPGAFSATQMNINVYGSGIR